MHKIIRTIVLVTGIVGVIALGAVIVFHRPPQAEAPPIPFPDARKQLESFLVDKLDYGSPSGQVFAEKRIEYARNIAIERPELEYFTSEVIDSLRARLKRKAGI